VTVPAARNEYGVYHVPQGLEGRPAARAVLAGTAYEPDTLRFMRRHAGRGDIVHAGAFFGDFIPALANALGPDGRLWAFEPNPGNCAAARRTIALNELDNVTLANAALSNVEAAVRFRTTGQDGRPLGGLSHFVEADGPGVEPVQAAMLDYAIPRDRRIGIVQLDVEGHEKQALKGAYHLIHRWRPILILEYFGQLKWIHRTFRGLDYTRVGRLHGNHVYAVEGAGITL
jgi:FkbM family methyltransferase